MEEQVEDHRVESPQGREPRTFSYTRLLSDGSTHSDLSLDSSEYYRAEIFHQLPSVQACRPEQSAQGPLGAGETHGAGPDTKEEPASNVRLSRGAREKEHTWPLRNLAVCIQAKRDARVRRKMQVSNVGFWESWSRSQSIHRRKVWEHMGAALSGLLPWHRTLRSIEGRFGVGVKAYFVFLRYLVCLNLLHCALVWGFILVPTTIYGRSNSSELLRFGGNDSVLDLFQGTGFVDRSPLFHGFYTHGSLMLPCLNTPLLYFAGILAILFLSLIMVVRRTTVGFKHTWMLGKRYSGYSSFKVFCGWDFTIQCPDGATSKRSCIRNDLKLFLEEQSFSLRTAQRTLGQRVRLYLLRFTLNVLVLSLLGGAFYLIFYATLVSLNESGHHLLVSLFLQYLPPITISFVNLLLPHIFRKISSFEDYSFTTQVNVTLVRSIFLKLASLGIYLFFLFKTTPERQHCRENQFGREMYKLCIFNFFATFCDAFLLSYPRKLVQEKYPTSLLSRLSGKQHFLIPFNVLGLVYGQTVSWVGIYYCPLLPLIGIVTLVATFYIKKFTVLRCCVAEHRKFQASTSSVLFHFMLLLGLLLAATTVVFNLYPRGDTPDNMSSCGPFGNGETVLNVTTGCVKSLPGPAQSAIRFMASEAFVLPLLFTEIVILTSYLSRGRANQKAIERLKDMLVMISSDKRFLVKQHTTILPTSENRSQSALRGHWRGRRPPSREGHPPRPSSRIEAD